MRKDGKYAFISYSSKNQQMADSVRLLFQEKGIPCWMAPYDIPAGSKYAYVINDALENCGCLVLLLTNASQESQFVEREIERAITYRKPIVPLQLEQLQLNSGFKFYIGNSQIIAVPEIRADAPEFKKALEGIRTFVGCPEEDGGIPRTKTVLQRIPQECGAASLEIIFSYFGKSLTLDRMCQETKTSEMGCNAGELMRTAKRFGLDCHGYKKESVGQLLEMPMPCIIHWDFNHFLVLEGMKDGDVYLNDPVCGRRTVTTAELDKHFTGVVLTFQPTENW